jgi:hypothetical protein
MAALAMTPAARQKPVKIQIVRTARRVMREL